MTNSHIKFLLLDVISRVLLQISVLLNVAD